jgi:hypothetical protein
MRAVYMYSWVVNATKMPDETDKSVESFEQMILGLLYSSGKRDGIEFARDLNGYYPTRDFEEMISEVIDEYNEDQFWEELIERLAARDYERSGAARDSREAFPKKLFGLQEKYREEFEKNGLDRLAISR